MGLYQLTSTTWLLPLLISQARDFMESIYLENVKLNLIMVSMELTQSHPMPTELLYQLTQLVWLPPPLTLTKKLPKLPETSLVKLLSSNRGNNLIKCGEI